MPHKDIPEFIGKLRTHRGVSASALEFAILTVMRTGATHKAEWTEFDYEQKIWTVPAERMKRKGKNGNKPHRVALCDRAIAILQSLPREDGNPYVFLGIRRGKALSEESMRGLLIRMGYDGDAATVHGFRSSFKDWAHEKTSHARDAIEMAMGHVLRQDVEAAYLRSDLLEKRFVLANDWATHCEPKGEAVSLRN